MHVKNWNRVQNAVDVGVFYYCFTTCAFFTKCELLV